MLAAFGFDRFSFRLRDALFMLVVASIPLAIGAAAEGSGVRLWFTRAPRMKQKAALFPGATIVCGIDTLLRVADPQFASGSEAQRDRDLAEIAGHDCRFLVFGRQTPRGFETVDSVTIPDALRRLSTCVPESEFRADVSSPFESPSN